MIDKISAKISKIWDIGPLLGVIFVFQAQRRGGAEVFSFRREGEFFKEIF